MPWTPLMRFLTSRRSLIISIGRPLIILILLPASVGSASSATSIASPTAPVKATSGCCGHLWSSGGSFHSTWGGGGFRDGCHDCGDVRPAICQPGFVGDFKNFFICIMVEFESGSYYGRLDWRRELSVKHAINESGAVTGLHGLRTRTQYVDQLFAKS